MGKIREVAKINSNIPLGKGDAQTAAAPFHGTTNISSAMSARVKFLLILWQYLKEGHGMRSGKGKGGILTYSFLPVTLTHPESVNFYVKVQATKQPLFLLGKVALYTGLTTARFATTIVTGLNF